MRSLLPDTQPECSRATFFCYPISKAGAFGARGGALGAPPVARQPVSGIAPKARRQTLPPSRSDSIGRPIFQLASNGLLVLDSVTVSP